MRSTARGRTAEAGFLLLESSFSDPRLLAPLSRAQGSSRFKTTPPRYEPSPRRLEAFGGRPPPELRINRDVVAVLRGYQRVVHTHGPLLAVALVLVLIACGVRPEPNRRDLRPEAAALALGGLGMLAVPAVTATYQYRYLIPSIPLLWVAGVLAGWHLHPGFGGVRRPPRLDPGQAARLFIRWCSPSCCHIDEPPARAS